MIGDVLRARRTHRRALRLWANHQWDESCAAEERAIAVYTRSRPRTPAQVQELTVLISTRAGFACARTDHATAARLYRGGVGARDSAACQPRPGGVARQHADRPGHNPTPTR